MLSVTLPLPGFCSCGHMTTAARLSKTRAECRGTAHARHQIVYNNYPLVELQSRKMVGFTNYAPIIAWNCTLPVSMLHHSNYICDIIREAMVLSLFSSPCIACEVMWCRQSCSIENYNKTSLNTDYRPVSKQCEISYHSQNFHQELQEVCTDLHTCCCHRRCSIHLTNGCNTSSDPDCSWYCKLIKGRRGWEGKNQ